MEKADHNTETAWRDKLTPEQYRICRECGTEPAFTGQYWDCHDAGIYRCVCCGNDLFDSEDKFDSGSGWPSYCQPRQIGNIITSTDTRYGMKRVEVSCKKCNAHLGHVFEDGPKPSGLRYCINSAALILEKS